LAINTFDEILAKGIRAGQMPGKTQEAINWYRNTAQKLSSITETQLMRNVTALTTQIQVGRLYFFYYDPKFKKELPYYDMFPVVFPFEKVPGGFLGLNLHYLPYILRAKLMDKLYGFINDPKLDSTAKLKISYNILKNASTNQLIKPCIKHYLKDHLRSRFLFVEPAEWDTALFLPVERFAKASKQTVWKDSKRIAGVK
jgi:hypothetical protein